MGHKELLECSNVLIQKKFVIWVSLLCENSLTFSVYFSVHILYFSRVLRTKKCQA